MTTCLDRVRIVTPIALSRTGVVSTVDRVAMAAAPRSRIVHPIARSRIVIVGASDRVVVVCGSYNNTNFPYVNATFPYVFPFNLAA